MSISARASSSAGAAGAEYLPARLVWERYNISAMTLWRWIEDDAMTFPRPVYFGRLRFFKIAELEAWELDRARKSAPTRPTASAGAR
jgi:predicted DNA-binding transcriptional regulator AlpA